MLSINSLSGSDKTNQQQENSSSKLKLWDDRKRDLFLKNIKANEVQNIMTSLENLKPNNVSQTSINNVVEKIETLFTTTAKQSFGTKTILSNKNKNCKKWFDKECREARNTYHNVRKLYNKHKNTYFKSLLKTVSKEYKNKISKNIRKFKNQRVNKLKTLKTSNPKEFWKIINSVDKQSSSVPPLSELHTFFKNLNSCNDSYDDSNENAGPELETMREINEEINQPISNGEILLAINKIKNNKSPGSDNILNEHIKCTTDMFLPIYTKLFNLVLDTGIVPESWALGDILPIYKNKGSIHLPENYRPITLLSCLGKLFTSVMNNRLNKFVEHYELISNCQAGFRKGLSTTDNLFVLQSLIEISKSCKNVLYCAFIDFKQAFDNVWRSGLWQKLQEYNINGKCLNVIKSMYNNIKSRISIPEGNSAFFPCEKGVRQGENLSPILFSLYLNDLEHLLE